MKPNTLGMLFTILPLSEIFFFPLILKYGGSNILVLGGRNVKERRALLHLLNPELLRLG